MDFGDDFSDDFSRMEWTPPDESCIIDDVRWLRFYIPRPSYVFGREMALSFHGDYRIAAEMMFYQRCAQRAALTAAAEREAR